MVNCWNIKRVILITVLLAMFLVVNFFQVYANSISAIEEQKKQLEQEMKRTEQQLKNIKKQESNISKELKNLNINVSKVTQDINELEKNINTVQAYISSTQNEISVKQQELDNRSSIFENRLKEIYMQGEIDYLEVLLGSESFTDFLVRFEFLKRITQNDMEILKELENERNNLEEKKLALEVQRQDINNLILLKESNKQSLQIASARQQESLSDVKNERDTLEKMLNEMEKESEKLAQEILKIASKGNFTGTLTWPTPGYSRITSPFGGRIHPITRKNSFHSGIDIAAPMGAKVAASANGKILFAGWQGAYGNTIVVDHGGLTTMYAHLSSILVKAGASVKQGQQIGKIGTTGWSTGPHLHFEIRINGEAANPLNYLKR